MICGRCQSAILDWYKMQETHPPMSKFYFFNSFWHKYTPEMIWSWITVNLSPTQPAWPRAFRYFLWSFREKLWTLHRSRPDPNIDMMLVELIIHRLHCISAFNNSNKKSLFVGPQSLNMMAKHPTLCFTFQLMTWNELTGWGWLFMLIESMLTNLNC